MAAGGAPSLLEVAARRLASGPAHTLELAREVMGLTGNAGAASKAVFTLLGSDPRFGVDPSGTWTLRDGASLPGPPLSRLSFAVVDVETTGGSWTRGDRITEVAVVHVEQGAIVSSYDTLVNPGRRIPPWVQGLTGITDAMVAPAPPFEGIADHLAGRLEGRLFVAHNAPFDWRFVEGEFLQATGDVPAAERLCTVRMGRCLCPQLHSHGLDALTAHFRIRVEGRHRALGDALATAEILLRFIREAEGKGIGDLATLRARMSGAGSAGGRPVGRRGWRRGRRQEFEDGAGEGDGDGR